MKRKIILRSLIGAPLGLSISFIIAIIISFIAGDGEFYPVVPELAEDFNSEISAVTFQSIISIIYGAVWGGASAIWENEKWSLLKQTLSHLIICSLATLPIAYFSRWMEHSTAGIAKYFGIFFVIYFFIWLSMYISIKIRLNRINKKLEFRQ